MFLLVGHKHISTCCLLTQHPTVVQAAAKRAPSKPGTANKQSMVVPEPSLNVPLGFLAVSGASAYAGVEPLAWFAGILGVFLAFQSTRVRWDISGCTLQV